MVRFLIDLLTTNNIIYHDLLILNFPYLTIQKQPLTDTLEKRRSWDSKLSQKKPLIIKKISLRSTSEEIHY